jgi:1-acyl-sn-glycerol-3-phosphate acyltransferase
MGAFIAATQNGTPIVPVTIRGTRAILQSDSNFPHHGAVRIIIAPALEPKESNWAEAVRLKIAAREMIASHYNERDVRLEDQAKPK